MRYPSAACLMLAVVAVASRAAADPPPTVRVVEGRVLDAAGKPPAEGIIFFVPVERRGPDERLEASLGPDGAFRVEIRGDRPAPGMLRYVVYAPGFLVGRGSLGPVANPTRLDVRLEPGPWPETELALRDQQGRPVGDAEVEVDIGVPLDHAWKTSRSDAGGRCTIASPPQESARIVVRRPGFSSTLFYVRGMSQDPRRLVIPLRPPIRGRAVDPEGRPVANLMVGRFVATDGFEDAYTGRLTLPAQPGFRADPARTDAEGRFTIDADFGLQRRPKDPLGTFVLDVQPASFLDPEAGRLAFGMFERAEQRDMEEVVIRPTRRIRMRIENELPVPKDGLEVRWVLLAPHELIHPQFLMRGFVPATPGPEGRTACGSIEVALPPGRYDLQVSCYKDRRSPSVEAAPCKIEITPGDGVLDLPPLRTVATTRDRLTDQPAPEIDAADMTTGAPVRLADYRGKVVVLDFWGTWCSLCVSAMPGLMELHRRFEGRPVAILALHDQSVASREGYERKIAPIRRELWGGRDLPFRVLLDRPDPEFADEPVGHGLSCKRYDVRGFPTTLVIDPSGQVVGSIGSNEHARLEAMIECLLAQAPPR